MPNQRDESKQHISFYVEPEIKEKLRRIQAYREDPTMTETLKKLIMEVEEQADKYKTRRSEDGTAGN